MRTYKVKVYDTSWRTIHQEFITAPDMQSAELKEEMIADECIDNGAKVAGTSLERVR